MSQLFSGIGSIDIPSNNKFGGKKGKFGRMAGSIIQSLGGLSSTPGLNIEPRGLTREERKDPNATGVIYNRERGSKGAEAVNYSPRTAEKDEIERKLKEKAEGKVGSKKSRFGERIGQPPFSIGTTDFIDSDGNGVDDRYQKGPGQSDYRDETMTPRQKRNRRRAMEGKSRVRKGRPSMARGNRKRVKKNLSEFDFTPKRPKFGTELIPPDNYDGKVGRPPVPMSKEDYDQINRRKRKGNMEDTNHPFIMFK